MEKISFIFAVHNHQPLGNFDSVVEEAFQTSYKPFIEVLEKFPSIKISLHYSGILLEWMYKHHHEFIEILRKLIHEGQIEILTGSYYEAILSIIPPNDRKKQIDKLTEYINRLFDIDPKGMWLAERVWEQPIVKEISESGVKFLPIDEAHFKYVGISDEELLGYYTTEEQGYSINIFPGNKKLRYTVPFAPVEETINYLKSLANVKGDRIVVLADDGEKFGSWPKTYKHVYEDGWLENFFKELVVNQDWLNTIHFEDALGSCSPIGQIYLPTASYPEMLQWALPVKVESEYEKFENTLKSQDLLKYEMFVRGGYWRNFLVKYPEANWMHKKMLRISEKLQKYETKTKTLTKLNEFLLAAQCNDAYWHGIFGGLYLPHLRFPIYHNLLQAEYLMDKKEKKQAEIAVTDFDCDGNPEILYESEKINVYIKPSSGGIISEFDFKPLAINFLDIISRREEASHRKFLHDMNTKEGKYEIEIKQENLHDFLIYDKYQRVSLIDHFFDTDTTVEQFEKMDYYEKGDFVIKPYDFKYNIKDGIVNIELSRIGTVEVNGIYNKIQIIKKILLKDKKSDLEINYHLINLSDEPIDIRFGVECNYGLLAGDAPDRYYSVKNIQLEDKRLRSIGYIRDVNAISLIDEWLNLKIDLHSEHPAEFWRCPIETVSLSESGLEKIYQSSTIIPIWKIHLIKEWNNKIIQEVNIYK